MGEIKSTLDLVMERTRNLSMTPEEKAQQRKTDFEKRLQGLLNKYEDEALSVDIFLTRMTELQEELKMIDQQEVMKAVLARIDPDQDNKRWLYLTERLEPEIIGSLETILTEYLQQKGTLLAAGQHQALAQLAENHAVSGSAVVPNPYKNQQVMEKLAGLRAKTRSDIDSI